MRIIEKTAIGIKSEPIGSVLPKNFRGFLLITSSLGLPPGIGPVISFIKDIFGVFSTCKNADFILYYLQKGNEKMKEQMTPIPSYLSGISKFEKSTVNTVTFSIQCPCGNNVFNIETNCPSKEEKKILKPINDEMNAIFSRKFYSCNFEMDENGKKFAILWLDSGKKEILPYPEVPAFAIINVLRAVCPQCHKVHTLFDSRFHGYDAMFTEEKMLPDYTPTFRSKCKTASRIEIKVENDSSLAEFNENVGEDSTPEKYSDSFTWIWIYAIDEDGKKRKIFDCETA